MTAQATRDALAEMDGWRLDTPTDRTHPAALWWRWNDAHMLKSRTWCRTHPHPPTLDGADAAVPEGWTWGRMHDIDDGGIWTAVRVVSEGVWVDERSVPDTGDKIADLYALALACRKAMEASK